ncbi:MAG: hypothetical protein Q7R76_00290 [Candidatus Woesearchaeota archaeon]|nr:hypothetical protein [Candidatus Woesearchaeota archaeon]
MDACIKNINDEEWREFKSESARHGMKMGDFFTKLVADHRQQCTKGNAKEILFGEKPLKDLLKDVDYKKIRGHFKKTFKMRRHNVSL